MMTWSPELLEYTRGRLLAREAAFGPRREEVSAALAACAGEETAQGGPHSAMRAASASSPQSA